VPVKDFALKEGLTLHQPEHLKQWQVLHLFLFSLSMLGRKTNKKETERVTFT
jgi:hypothetical protein